MKRLVAVVVVSVVAGLVPSLTATATPEEHGGLHHFIGALHEHSGYSDGFPGSEPRDYYASAKAYGIDFLGSGEHSDNADVPFVANEECLTPAIADCAIADKDRPEDSFRKWDATLEQARAATDDSFTGFRGFEWSSDRFGHINVYFSRNDTNAKADGGYAAMETFWEWFRRDPVLEGGADGLATFNHPGDKSLDDGDPGFNWNDFAYVPEADNRMVGLEVYNGTKDFARPDRGFFTRALDKGWHVGAIGAEDKGHDRADGNRDLNAPGDDIDDWGGPAWAKTVVIATDMTEAGLREAMLARRFYAVLDNSIRMDLRAGGHPMGSRITRDHGATIGFDVDVWQVDGLGTSQQLSAVEIVSNGGTVVAHVDSPTLATENEDPAATADLSVEVPAEDGERYYFARVLDASGKAWAYSSPVWIDSAIAHGGEWLADQEDEAVGPASPSRRRRHRGRGEWSPL